MLFSIIVPVYNVEPYIHNCLQSIEDQYFTDYEMIIVMDETSMDKSAQIVETFRKKYSNVIVVMQGHHGLGAARNHGMRYASGDYLVFLDSDDTFGDKHYLQDMANAIENTFPDYVISRTIKYVGDIGGEVGSPWEEAIINSSNSRDALIRILNSGYFGISVWGKAIRREFVQVNGLQFVDGYCEDYDWTSKIINLTDRYAFVNTPGVVHYIRPGSLSGNHNFQQVNDLGIRIVAWINQIGNSSEFEKAQLGYLAYSYYIYIALIHYIDKIKQKKLWDREKNLRFLQQYGKSKKCRLSAMVCKVLGIKLGSYILYEYIKRKKSYID